MSDSAATLTPSEAARMVEYLVGHAPDNDGRNPFGQDHVVEMLAEFERPVLEAVAYQAIWRMANEAAAS